jgi:hypothetical protein
VRSFIYLFCFARSGLLPAIEGTGVDGQSPLFLHTLLDIAAVFCGSGKASIPLSLLFEVNHPGRAYIASRKAYYEQEERFAKEISTVIEGYHAAFAGLAVKCKAEIPPFYKYGKGAQPMENRDRDAI